MPLERIYYSTRKTQTESFHLAMGEWRGCRVLYLQTSLGAVRKGEREEREEREERDGRDGEREDEEGALVLLLTVGMNYNHAGGISIHP